jgi:hypothetical protein
VIDRHSLDAYRAGLTAFIAAHPVTLTLSRQQTTGNDTAAARAEPAERSSRRSPR